MGREKEVIAFRWDKTKVIDLKKRTVVQGLRQYILNQEKREQQLEEMKLLKYGTKPA